jgi:hypothetical protein
MKSRAFLVLALSGVVITLFIAAVPRGSAAAKVCYDPNNPNKVIPCPEKKQKTETPAPPTATSTPTATLTPTPTLTPAPPPPPVAAPPMDGGFACPPLNNGMLLGAGLLGAGLITLALAGRGPFSANGFRNTGSGSAPPDWGRPAARIGDGSSPNFFRRFSTLLGGGVGSTRDLPSMNQGPGSGAGVTRLLGSALSGSGAGLLGAGLLGGAFNLACPSAPPVLLAGAVLGLLARLGAGTRIGRVSPVGADGKLNADAGYSTFEPIGNIQEDGSVTGSAGMYHGKDLE